MSNFRKAFESKNKEDSEKRLGQLLWTAPELLAGRSCLDDVGRGSLEGDVYSYVVCIVLTLCADIINSYAMIMFEVLTGEVPFQSIGMDMSELVGLIGHQPIAIVINKPRAKEVCEQ